jgi:hypothetical protein
MADWTLFLLSEKADAHNGQRGVDVHNMLMDAPCIQKMAPNPDPFTPWLVN